MFCMLSHGHFRYVRFFGSFMLRSPMLSSSETEDRLTELRRNDDQMKTLAGNLFTNLQFAGPKASDHVNPALS